MSWSLRRRERPSKDLPGSRCGTVGVRGWPYTALVRNRRNEAANDVRLAQAECIAVGQRDLVKVDWVDESGHYLKVHFCQRWDHYPDRGGKLRI